MNNLPLFDNIVLNTDTIFHLYIKKQRLINILKRNYENNKNNIFFNDAVNGFILNSKIIIKNNINVFYLEIRGFKYTKLLYKECIDMININTDDILIVLDIQNSIFN